MVLGRGGIPTYLLRRVDEDILESGFAVQPHEVLVGVLGVVEGEGPGEAVLVLAVRVGGGVGGVAAGEEVVEEADGPVPGWLGVSPVSCGSGGGGGYHFKGTPSNSSQASSARLVSGDMRNDLKKAKSCGKMSGRYDMRGI